MIKTYYCTNEFEVRTNLSQLTYIATYFSNMTKKVKK